MKSDVVFKRAYNQLLDLISTRAVGADLPSESQLSEALGVSRTTVRKVLTGLDEKGVIKARGRSKIVLQPQHQGQYYPVTETVSTSNQVEKLFMEWMLRVDTKPGTLINELELARQFGVGTTGIREFLYRFSRFGLIEKRPNSGWLFKGFTREFAMELFEIRELFELRSAVAFSLKPKSAPEWQRLELIKKEHIGLLAEIDKRFHDFSDLDDRFHRLIHDAAKNRFIDDFYDIIAFIFHYHYQWNKRHEKQRNRVAIEEHLDYIEALFSGEVSQVKRACSTHLVSARRTLLDSFGS